MCLKPFASHEEMNQVVEKYNSSGYWKLLGMEIVGLGQGFARVTMPFKPELTQTYQIVHGGAVSSLVDSAVAAALRTLTRPTEKITTVELKVNYLLPVLEGELVAEAKILQKGNQVAVGTVEVKNMERLVAYGIATYMILK